MEYRDRLTKKDQKILERFAMESAFAATHAGDSDETLLSYLKDCAAALNHIPTKKEVIGCRYLKQRFGSWNRVLEKAGLKTVTEKRVAKLKGDAARREEKETAV